MRRRLVAISVAVLLMTAGATTGPTTSPAPDPAVGRWFDRVADADPAVRADGRERLMCLRADRLPDLLAAARAAVPLRPDQAAVLREIVTQVVLTGEAYDVATPDNDPTGEVPRGTRYIMGQDWPFPDEYRPPRLGVPVVHCWPGFPAARLLRGGDLIVGLYNAPTPGPARPPTTRRPPPRTWSTACGPAPAGRGWPWPWCGTGDRSASPPRWPSSRS